MKLSSRLNAICGLVDEGTNVVDIGCDHALIDIYLTKYNNNKCIAADISENALNNAKNNINKHHLNGQIDVVLSDGLESIILPNNNTVVLSGMGTKTILKILENKYDIDSLIISSHNNLYELRKNIIKKGYYIEKEIKIIEKNIYYTIIKFKKGKRKYNYYNYIYGIDFSNKDYVSYCIEKNKVLIKTLPKKYFIKKFKLKLENSFLKEQL